MRGGYSDDFNPVYLPLMQSEADRLYAAVHGLRLNRDHFHALPPGVCQYRALTTRSELARDAVPIFSDLEARGYHLYSGTWVHPDGSVPALSPDVFRKCRRRVHRAASRLGPAYALLGFVEADWDFRSRRWQVHEHFLAAVQSDLWQEGYEGIRNGFSTAKRLPNRVRVPLQLEPVTDLPGWCRYQSKGLMLHGNRDRRIESGAMKKSPLRDQQALDLVRTLSSMSPNHRVILSGEISLSRGRLEPVPRRTS
jgi:hypothetical protein